MQQVLHVQCIDAILRVVLDELVGDDERLVRVWGANAIEGETTGQTGNGAEQAFKGLRHVMRDEVLVDLHHGDDGLLRVGQLGFTTNTQ